MIRFNNVSVQYSSARFFDSLNMNFELNKIHGIVGLNGAGKTTFFNALAAHIKLLDGSISFNGTQLLNKDISYLETVNYFYSRITGREYLKIFDQTNKNFNLELLNSYFKLPLDELIENYSTGMKKKIALLGILKQDRPIVLLDEPFNGLDLESNKILELIIKILKERNKTMFLSSHIIDPLLTTCDFIHVIEKGKFQESFTKENFNQLEKHLFGRIEREAADVINGAI